MASMHGVDWSANEPTADGARGPDAPPRKRWRHGFTSPGRAILGLVAVCALTTSLGCLVASQLVWNRTASLPLGVYVRTPSIRVNEGALVALPVPPSVRALVHDRRYLPDGSLLIKPVVATAGDSVCTLTGILFINGEPFGGIRPRDSEGRLLPVYRACGVLPEGQVFLASHHLGSFDSRNFGPVDVRALQGTVIPLWTY